MRPSLAWVILTVYACICSSTVTQTYNDGQWRPSSSYYTSIYVASTTYMASIAYITQANAVVTVTSYVPYPVTTTVYIYQCNGQCPTAAVPTTTVVPTVGQFGTTTVTRYTTQSGGETYQYQTVTSGSYVLVIANPTTAAVQGNVSGAASVKPFTLFGGWRGVCGLLVLWVGMLGT